MFKKTSLFCCLVLSILLCVSGLSLAYNEAPELKEKVERGDLPSVEERLPEEPLVFEPFDEVGQYGGTLNVQGTERWFGVDGCWSNDDLLFIDYDGEIHPDIAKDYSVSDDYKVYTFKIREGIKFDDGEPLTVEDVEFYYKDILQNEELTPVFPDTFKKGGERAELVLVDDYEFRLEFKAPHYTLLYEIGAFFQPKHYLKDYHIDYNENANELAQEEGYSDWVEAIQSIMQYFHLSGNPEEYPVIAPWTIEKLKTSEFTLTRNPYYHKVDPEGNQYPYIDKISVEIIDSGIYEMRAMSEQIDFALTNTSLESYPMYMENREQGNYRVFNFSQHQGAEPAIGFNLNHEDPAIREIFQEINFRKALSHAINRDEINDALAFGKAVPRQATISDEASFFKEKWANAYIEYNPEKSKELLDEIGVTDRNGDGYRERPDGEDFVIVVETVNVASRVPLLEMVERYWDDIGINTKIQVRERELYRSRAYDGEHMAGTWGIGHTPELQSWGGWGERFWLPGDGNLIGYAPRWGYWLTAGEDHELAERPPQKVIDLYETFKKWKETPRNTSEYIELGEKIWDFHYENLWMIGTLGFWPQPALVAQNLKNIPEDMFEDRPPAFDHFRNTYKKIQFQFYFEE